MPHKESRWTTPRLRKRRVSISIPPLRTPGPGFWAPVKPTWAIDNRTASFRVIPGSPKSTRLETRCPGADINPYLAVAALVAAGMHGVEQGMKLTSAPITGTNLGSENVPRAPRSLKDTTAIFRDSKVARDWLGDVFVATVPQSGALWQVSTGGGTMPRWRRDGRELYFRANDGTLMAVALGSGPGTAAIEQRAAPRPLFPGIPSPGNSPIFTYDATEDGQRFLVATARKGAQLPITVLVNWHAALTRRAQGSAP